ncbi:MAG: hypothetical protein HW416_887, partial [Chloroflexi bacterium]|nr:hypothetical protein [Chloroflexota bacterium]
MACLSRLLVLLLACFQLHPPAVSADSPVVAKPALGVLRAAAPDASNRFVGSSAPGQLFFPDESVDVRLVLAREGAEDMVIEMQEITLRDLDHRLDGMEGYTDGGGHAPVIELAGAPIRHQFRADLGSEAETALELRDLPLPARFGTYALVLDRGGKRQLLATVARVPRPRPYGTIENTPILGEGAMLDEPDRYAQRGQQYARMGVRGWRTEVSWSEREDGSYDWSRYDAIFQAAEDSGIKIMVTLGTHPTWAQPFRGPTPAAGWRPTTGGYSGTGDWLTTPDLYERYGRWITAFCERYWKDGRGALWGLENYNEPWEGGGISGWARDALEYRKLQKLIADSARKVSPDIKLLAASSIMNTEDKFYSDGSNEFDQYVDVFTDHYVVPALSYGPMVARAHGKASVETETWLASNEPLVAQAASQFLATGQGFIAPWDPRLIFDKLPGTQDAYFVPTPIVSPSAAFNYFVTGKRFERFAFLTHLPWALQFGKDDDAEGVVVLLGQLMTVGGGLDARQRPWLQVDTSPGGTITLDNADGLLRFFDLNGNPAYVGQASVTLPLSPLPVYVKSDRGPAAVADRLRAGPIEGKRPVEILPQDFSTLVTAPQAALNVALHNALNRPITGTLTVTPAEGIVLVSPQATVELGAGETRTVAFEISSAQSSASNAYPFSFRFASPDGSAEYAEVMNAAIAPRLTPIIDGALDDWASVPGVTILGGVPQAEITALMQRPWLDLRDRLPSNSYAEFKLAWDEGFLYVAARVRASAPQPPSPPMAGRDENQYFHSATSDQRSPYREFLASHPSQSFASVPYVYRDSPEIPTVPDLPFIPFRRDRLQIGLDVTDDWHDLASDSDRVPYGFHAVPDTDYEYALYMTRGGGSELWRLLAPGVPRIHDFPRVPRGPRTTGPVPGARNAVKLDGDVYTYEMAIPRDELANLSLAPGARFGLTVRAGNQRGGNVDYGPGKAVS